MVIVGPHGLARYHDIKISDAGVTRILKRNVVGPIYLERARGCPVFSS